MDNLVHAGGDEEREVSPTWMETLCKECIDKLDILQECLRELSCKNTSARALFCDGQEGGLDDSSDEDDDGDGSNNKASTVGVFSTFSNNTKVFEILQSIDAHGDIPSAFNIQSAALDLKALVEKVFSLIKQWTLLKSTIDKAPERSGSTAERISSDRKQAFRVHEDIVKLMDRMKAMKQACFQNFAMQ